MGVNPITTVAATKFIVRTNVSQALKKYVSEEFHCFKKYNEIFYTRI